MQRFFVYLQCMEQPGVNFIERPDFHISPDDPVRLHVHSWTGRQRARFDMHFGLEIGIITHGRMRRYTQDHQFDVGSGGVWLCGMWQQHGYEILQKDTHAVVLIIYPPALLNIQLNLAHPVRWLGPFELPPTAQPLATAPEKKRILALADDFIRMNREKSHSHQAWLQLRMMELLLIINDLLPHQPQRQVAATSLLRINRAISLVFASRKGVSTQQAAATCNLNRNAFAKMFADSMGMRFSEFDTRYRISSAAAQLRNTATPVKSIAAAWGFSDQAHFHRVFAKYYSKTPGEYRQEAAQ